MMEHIKQGISFFRRVSFTTLSHQDRLDILFGTFFVHLILTVWSSPCGCLPQSFIVYNSFFLFTIIWSLHQRESEEAPFMAMCINLLSIVFDIVNLALYWPLLMTGSMKFGGAMAVMNLVLRPISSFLLFRIVQDRAREVGGHSLPSGFEGIFASRKHTQYEDIDQAPGTKPLTSVDPESGPTSSALLKG
ncbi:uncharacterized protein LOC121861590 [Homarus americanus]|uniref:uncharacterized protein LOC121861590 n=1 Tax=Homarus americanus TaxID=6706 RepID=UPI001C48A58E|nr:uncharacterized protein LOC121861590 [Homarus americanus]